jgi:acyl-CoA thioesterase
VTDLTTGGGLAVSSISVDRSWWSAAGVHGGHLAGLTLDAMRGALKHEQPARSLTVRFLSGRRAAHRLRHRRAP